MIEEKRIKMRSRYGIAKEEEKPYVMLEEKDYEALAKIKDLERKELNSEDKKMVWFIRTQLEDDWRKPLLDKLNRLLSKYK